MTCEYCRGTLGCDSSGACRGCGAPMPNPQRVVTLVSKGRHRYGAMLESVLLDGYRSERDLQGRLHLESVALDGCLAAHPPRLTDERYWC